MSTNRKYKLHNGKTGSAITIHLTTKASKNQIYEILNDGTIKIYLKASGSNEEINLALVKYLAGILKTDTQKIEVIAGHSGMDKLVTILDIDVNTVNDRIINALS